MKISAGLKENGIVIGNTYDKYGSKNPIVKRMMRGYENSLNRMVSLANPDTIHEIGCGEGYWTLKWLEKGINAIGSDFSGTVIDIARNNAIERKLPAENFKVRNIYELNPETDSANLVVCCQVLEHLENPEEALLKLKNVAKPFVIICVPKEPIWRILNMARGKYWSEWGNTPGHIQHWSKKNLTSVVSNYLDVIATETPFPWTMLLCKSK